MKESLKAMMKVKVVVIVKIVMHTMKNGIKLELLHEIGRYTSMVEASKYYVQLPMLQKGTYIHRMVCLHARS